MRLTALCLVVGSCFTAPATGPSALTQISLRNPQMTDGTNQPAHWTQTWVGKGKIKVSRDATTYHSAPAALALEAIDGAAQAQVSQSFEVKGGERIKLAGWVRADGGANAMLALQSFTADWKGIDFKVVGNAITGLDWRKAEGEVTVPINAALKEFADGQKIRLLEVSERVLKPDRELEMKYYAGDKLHLSAEGYRLWADAMNPVLAELMK